MKCPSIQPALRRCSEWLRLLCLSLSVLTALGDEEGGFLFQKAGDQAWIYGYSGPDGPVVIPDRLGGQLVTSVLPASFERRAGVTSIRIPDGVTYIGDSAFFACTNLTNVTIGNGVTYIGGAAFRSCSSLREVSIPNGVGIIERDAFANCASLISITVGDLNTAYSSISGVLFDKAQSVLLAYPAGKTGSYVVPNGVASINDYAFSGCTALHAVSMPDNVVKIGNFAFSGCTSLTNLTLPSHLTSMGSDIFSGCTNLSEILIPDGVTVLGGSEFYGCTGLKRVNLPDGMTRIGGWAFSGCTSLTNVTLPSHLTSLDGYTFFGCTSLMNVTIPTGVTLLGERVFSGCSGLGSVTIRSSVISFRNDAFSQCPNLVSIYFEGNAPGGSSFVFGGDDFLTLFHRPGAAGWGSTFGGRPTALWSPRATYQEWVKSAGLVAQFPNASGEGDDPDGDGVANGDEWLAGTDPTQRASRLELELVPRPADLVETDRTAVPDGHHALHFRSVPGRYYGIQGAARLGDSWELQAVRVAGATQTRFVVPNPAANAYYRVVVFP